jgi:hypothetical protein
MQLHIGRLAVLDANIRMLHGRVIRNAARMPPFVKLLDNDSRGSDWRVSAFGVKADNHSVRVNFAVIALEGVQERDRKAACRLAVQECRIRFCPPARRADCQGLPTQSWRHCASYSVPRARARSAPGKSAPSGR